MTDSLHAVDSDIQRTPDLGPSTSELRTFLVADIRGYTRFTQEHGDEAAAELVAKFASLTREIVSEWGGQVVELRGDEALATFGSARQALRAAVALQDRFGRESRLDPARPLPVGIGIDAGEAVPLEGGYRGEALNLAARLCNLAGPGEVLASEGVVYLGRRVQGVSYAERGYVPLKGFTDPVRVIRVIGQEEGVAPEGEPAADSGPVLRGPGPPIGGFLGALPSGVLVGRDVEWNQIMAFLEDVMQGSGRLVLLSGEPGIGKTRLAQEVTLKARHWGFLVVTGRCYEPEQAVPYYPFLEALLAVYNACSGAIRAEIPQRWPYLARLLPDELADATPSGYPADARASADPVVGGARQGTPQGRVAAYRGPPPSSDGQQEQQRLFRAVTGFLEAVAAEQPLALLLDDLHWADDSSVRLLQHLARQTRGHRVLLLGTYRDVELHRHHPLEAALLDLSREQLLSELELRRLTPDGTAALVAEILGEKEGLEELAHLVHHRTEGNAFFIQEVVRTLVERGDVYRQDGRWELRKVSEMEVPKSIRSVIGQRLSHLSPRAQEILREASVLGQTFTFDDLHALGTLAPRPGGQGVGAGGPAGSSLGGVQRAGVDAGEEHAGWTEDEVEAALNEGVAAGLLRETERDAYAFNHGLTQQALYAELTTRRKKRLHLAAGKVLEAALCRGAAGTGGAEKPHVTSSQAVARAHMHRWAELAWHFLEGDDAEQALPYALKAGDQAEEVFAHREAERQYRTALELARELNDAPREVEALEKLAGVLTIEAQYDDALELLEQAAQLHRRGGDEEGERRAFAQMGQVHFHRGTREEGINLLQPLVDSLDQDPEQTVPSYSLAAMYAALARLYMDSEVPKKQLRTAERAVELARAVGDDHLLIGAEVTRSAALWALGQDEEALQVLEDLIPRAEALGDLENLARALGNAAGYYAGRGDLERDRLYQQRALAVGERRGDRAQILLAALQLSSNAFIVGDWARSRQYLDRTEAVIRSMGTTRLSPWPVAARGWLELREGDLEAAAECAEETLRLAENLGDQDYVRLAHRLLAETDLFEGRPEVALARLQAAMTTGEPSGLWKDDSGFLRTLARTYLALGNEREARRASTGAVARAAARKSPAELVEALVTQGAVLTHPDESSREQRLTRRVTRVQDVRPAGRPRGVPSEHKDELGSYHDESSLRDESGGYKERLSEAQQILEYALARARRVPFPFGEALALRAEADVYALQGETERARELLAGAVAIFERLGARKEIEQSSFT